MLGLPFLAFAGAAIALFTSPHGDPGRIAQGVLAALGAAGSAAAIGVAQRAWRNREADEAIARSVAWEAHVDHGESGAREADRVPPDA